MWILLIVVFFIPFVYIGHLMSKLDKFLAEGGIKTEEDEIGQVAIVLGETDTAKQITELLQKNNMQVLNLVEPFLLGQEQNFRYLFALSESDVDNIVLCKIGKKIYSIEKIISICNDRKNERVFSSEKIPYVSREEVTAQMLYQVVMQGNEVKL